MRRKNLLSARMFAALAIFAAVLALVAAACGDDEEEGEQPTATATEEAGGVAPPGPATFEVRAGDAEGVVTVNAFLPDDITVREGDTVRWTFPSPEIHTVSFLGDQEASAIIIPIGGDTPQLQINPAVAFPAGDPSAFAGAELLNSGILPSEAPPADSFDTTFTAAGSYAYVCLIHPNMTGTVTVVGADEEVPSAEAVTAAGDELLSTYVAEGQAAADELEATSIDNADGTKTWTMPMGVTTEHTDVLSFIPAELEVGVGDTVRFVNSSEAPHTASFSSGADVPAFIVPTPQAAGPPILALNPEVVEGRPATEPPVPYDGTGYVNSGILGPAPEFPAQEWSMVVTAPGTFSYVCILHLPNGMAGTITAAAGE